MTPGLWSAIGCVLGALVAVTTFYFTYYRPRVVLRGRVLDRLLGHDGKDGLPKEPSIFERLSKIEELLAQLTSEFPKNGIPTRAAVDRIAEELKSQQVREDQRWATLSAALLTQNIKIPTEG
jgi:hypothetical protein